MPIRPTGAAGRISYPFIVEASTSSDNGQRHDKHDMHPNPLELNASTIHRRENMQLLAPCEYTCTEKTAKRKIHLYQSPSPESDFSRKRSKHNGSLGSVDSFNPTPYGVVVNADEASEKSMQGYNEQHDHDVDQTIAHLVHQLKNARNEITNLQRALEQTKADEDAHHMRIRQDMLFDKLLQQDKAAKELRSERNRWYRVAASNRNQQEVRIKILQDKIDEMKKVHDLEVKSSEEVVERLACQLKAERSALEKKMTEIGFLDSEVTHCRSLLRTADEDLAEIQRIDNEEKAIREKKSRGLPPAYGSLDDAENLPPHGRHEDSGNVEVASIKRVVRDRFVRDLNLALDFSDEARQSRTEARRSTAGREFFRGATLALAEACRNMQAMLNTAEDESVPGSKQKRKEEYNENYEYPLPRLSKRVSLPDRLAKLIIDFCWMVLACFDVRALEVTLSPEVKAEAGKHMRTVDDVLLSILEMALSGGKECANELDPTFPGDYGSRADGYHANCSGHCGRMNEFQYFLTLIKAISYRFDKLTAKHVTTPTFTETCTWLAENAETERRLAVLAHFPPTRQASPAHG